MNEKRNKFVSYMNVDFLFVWGKCLFYEFLRRVFQEREGGQKRPKKGQEGGQKSNNRSLEKAKMKT